MIWYEKPQTVAAGRLRYAKLSLAEIPITVGDSITFPEHNITVSVTSSRMQLLWLRKQLICEACGLAAGFATLEAHKDAPNAISLYFYSYDYNGKEVLLTWDHRIPKAKDGSNEQSNAQCLCEICNVLKGDEDYKPTSIQKKRREKGLPIRYTYLADGSRIFQWTKKQWSTTLSGMTSNL